MTPSTSQECQIQGDPKVALSSLYASFLKGLDNNGDLIKHVELIDAGIQPWIHLNYDTKYSRKDWRLMNGYFLSFSSTQSQGVPKP